MADSSADGESVSEYHSASDGGQSDFSVVEDSPMPARRPGRPRGSTSRPQTSAGGASSSGAAESGPRRRRGQITPPSGSAAGVRQRQAPSRFSEDQQAEREARREKRKRKRENKLAAAGAEFDNNMTVNIRTTALSVAENLLSGCCKARLIPKAPATRRS